MTSGPKGRGFESRHFDQLENPPESRAGGRFVFGFGAENWVDQAGGSASGAGSGAGSGASRRLMNAWVASAAGASDGLNIWA